MVTIFNGATQLGTVVLTASHITARSVEFTPTTPLAAGSPSFTATITDAIGRVSAPSSPLSVTINTDVSIADSTYTENQSTPIFIDSVASVTNTGNANYSGGSINFAVTGQSSSETLGLSTVGSPDTNTGVISIVGSAVHRGTGSGSTVIGSVDGTLNGQGGQALKINFTTGFTNGQFDIGTNLSPNHHR